VSSAAGGPQPYRITASARRPAHPEAEPQRRERSPPPSHAGDTRRNIPPVHLGLLVLPALAIELTAAARDPATGSCIGGVIPGIGSRSPRNPW